MTESKAVIFGCSGLSLTDEERALFRGEKPWGYILFARNVSEPDQIRDLVADMRDSCGFPDAPVFIDQEGGRVQRLRPPIAAEYPPGATLGAVYQKDPEAGKRAAWLMSRLHAHDLLQLDITADCLPVLDVPVEGAHDVIGNRAYGTDPKTVSELGRAAAEGLLSGGVLPVIKHVPGHGRAFSDSHKELPVVDTDAEELRAHDFPPFKHLADMPMAMTAHVVYTAFDAQNPATTSETVVQGIIRGEIGFDGLLMSDDVSMHALAGTFADRTRALFAAGCDIALHCNGLMEEMREVASRTPVLAGEPLRRANRATSLLGRKDIADEQSLRAEFADYVSAVA